MYHYLEDKEFLGKLRRQCSDVINRLVNKINNEDVMRVTFSIVGSGARNLETQNAKEPIDLDYNLEILELYNLDWNRNARDIKEYVRKSFNEILRSIDWDDCKDSTSCLTTAQRYFTEGNQTLWSIDLAIITESNDGSWFRLIHKKTGVFANDEYVWNQGPNSQKLNEKVKWLKKNNLWNEVRVAYLNKKNMYLTRNDYNHSSFICYIEAVNEIYNKY